MFKNARTKRCVKNLASFVCLSGVCLFFIGCPPKIGDIYRPAEFNKFLKSQNFVPLPMPDSKYVLGSIIRVTDEDIRWIDDLTSCGFPISEFIAPSDIPSITFSKDIVIEASAVISIKNIEAGPEFSKVKKVKFELSEHGADALRLIRLQAWMQDPNNRGKFSDLCMSELLKPDTYLVTEVMRVSKGKYTLYDKTNHQIDLKLPTIGNILKIDPKIKHEVTSDGSLVIEKPVYFAVKRALRVGGGFETLGGGKVKEETADAKIEKIFLKKKKK